MCLVKGFPCFHRHRAEAFHQGAIAQEGSHHSSVSQVCIRGCQHNSLQFPFLYRSGCTAGSRATALWLCPRTARAHSYKSFSESSLLIEPAQGKVPYLPEFPKEQTSTRYFLTAQSKTSYPGCHQRLCCSQGSSGPPCPQHASSRAAPSCYGDSPGGRALSPHKPHHPARSSLGQQRSPLQRPG